MAVDLPWEGQPPICFPASFSGQPSLRRSTKQKLPLPPAGPRWSTFLRKVNHQLASLQANVVDLPWADAQKYAPPGALATWRPQVEDLP